MTDFDIPRRDEIEDNSDAAELREWHEECIDMADVILSQIESRRAAGTADPDWLIRVSDKLTFAKMATRRIERRLVELGREPPITRDTAENRRIGRLVRDNKELRKALAAAGVSDPTVK